MKLFSKQLTKLKFITMLIFGIIELICCIIFFRLYKDIYLKIFDQMKEASLIKIQSIAKSVNKIFEIIFIRHTQDLKFIAKHMTFLENEIDMQSDYYKNIINNKDKYIYNASLEELKKYFPEYYDDSQQKFLYLENYINNYIENKTNKINILNDLMNNTKHPELNSISFYKAKGNVFSIKKDIRKETATKYLISILKTVFIKNLIIKGRDFDTNHFFLLTEDELYIYPPDAYNNTLISTFTYSCLNHGGIFPGCILDTINLQMYGWTITFFYDDDYIYPIFPFPTIEENQYIEIECISIPFNEPLVYLDYSFSPKICMEINLTKVFSKGFFESKEAFHFLFFTRRENDIIILYNDRLELFSEISKIFNDPIYKKYYFNYESKEETKYYYFFSIFIFRFI